MKIIIEVPDKFLEIAKGIMLGACKNENQEKELLELVDCVKAKTEPIAVNLNKIYDDEMASQMSQMNIALACFAIGQVKDEVNNESDTDRLKQRLEAMQKQADELQRKIQEGKHDSN